MDHGGLVGDIVTHYHRLNPDRRPTVVFAISVTHSINIINEFVKSGVKAAYIDGTTPKPERAEILARLASGDLELVSNCMVLTEGWDMPCVSCCILARPTRSLGLFRRMVGRVLPPALSRQGSRSNH
jgi:DNA repair protein RadD